jgi:hypothetical protein
MWQPSTWTDVTAAIGTLSEAPDLDFKRQLSSNNDISKDIAAMTLYGGVIAYGIDEDAQARASAITKIPLKGVPEKIQLLVNTTIAPVPGIDITVLRENPGDGDGVVVVNVPRSPFSPHLARDRFPARAGTVTRYLTEPEISALYDQRRAALAPPATGEILGAFVEPTGGIGSFGGIGVLRVTISPYGPARHPHGARLKGALEAAVAKSAVVINGIVVPHLLPKAYDFLSDWEPRGTIGWRAGRASDEFEMLRSAMLVAGTCTHDLRLSFAATLGLEGEGGQGRCAFEYLWVAETVAFIAIAGAFLADVPGVTMLRIEVGLQGLDGAVSAASSRGRAFHAGQTQITDSDYRERIEAGVRECATDPSTPAREALDRLLVSFLDPGQDPFESLARGLG